MASFAWIVSLFRGGGVVVLLLGMKTLFSIYANTEMSFIKFYHPLVQEVVQHQ